MKTENKPNDGQKSSKDEGDVKKCELIFFLF